MSGFQECIDINVPICADVLGNFEMISKFSVEFIEGKCTIEISTSYDGVFGLGECFDSVNQKGKRKEVQVAEKFCNQGNISYCPIPFAYTNTGFGIYINCLVKSVWDFTDGIKVNFVKDSFGNFPLIYLFKGKPKDILFEYCKVTGFPSIIPKWSLGVWMSANRWSDENTVRIEAAKNEENKLPATVMVVEAWSDEATFYLWNESKWKNPTKLIDDLNHQGIKLVLWQVPVFKKLEDGRTNEQHTKDCAYAIENNLIVLNKDGTPYTIPTGHWFEGSMVPDFTNPETRKWWFEKRKYLLDSGVSGFKADGGEFIYSDDCIFHNGLTGLEMKSKFAATYVEAYSNFISKDRVLFSRAGYSGQQKYPMQWAGDQKSTWDEFKHILSAGISISLSGVPYWTYDIAGFAGPMPTVELYERSIAVATFMPAMQWHSEPIGGQFQELMRSEDLINDRSPWHMASFYKDSKLIDRVRYYFNLHMNLLPYIYDLSLKASNTGTPIIKHPIIEFPEDSVFLNSSEVFMLGDIVIFPITQESTTKKEITLPIDSWTDLYTGKKFVGGKAFTADCSNNIIPAYIRAGSAVALNLPESLLLGGAVGNDLVSYKKLCFLLVGESGRYFFKDDLCNEINICWYSDKVDIEIISGNVKPLILRKLPQWEVSSAY